MLVCCLCGKEIANGRGGNARPVGPGQCCKECDEKIVTPHRRSPPAETEEEHFEWLDEVETFFDQSILMLSDLMVFIRLAEGLDGEPDSPDWCRFLEHFREAYPDAAESLFAGGSPWMAKDDSRFGEAFALSKWDRLINLVDPAALPRVEGMLAAFKLAHGLVRRGEEEDIAKDTFPDYEP